jgi:hypothetical protein
MYQFRIAKTVAAIAMIQAAIFPARIERRDLPNEK